VLTYGYIVKLSKIRAGSNHDNEILNDALIIKKNGDCESTAREFEMEPSTDDPFFRIGMD
jgi:hypothetical protein